MTRRSGRILAAALCVALVGALVAPVPAASAAGPAGRFFAPVESPAPAARTKSGNSRLGRLARKPGVRHLLHPIGTVRAAAGKVKAEAGRAVQLAAGV